MLRLASVFPAITAGASRDDVFWCVRASFGYWDEMVNVKLSTGPAVCADVPKQAKALVDHFCRDLLQAELIASAGPTTLRCNAGDDSPFLRVVFLVAADLLNHFIPVGFVIVTSSSHHISLVGVVIVALVFFVSVRIGGSPSA